MSDEDVNMEENMEMGEGEQNMEGGENQEELPKDPVNPLNPELLKKSLSRISKTFSNFKSITYSE
jgi:hypothetical protein